MKRSKALLIAALAGGLAIAALAVPRTPPAAAPPPVPGAAAGTGRGGPPRGAPVESPALAPTFWARRVGMEALVLSAPGAAVEFLDATGGVLGSGRLDPAGAFRGSIPAGAGSLSLRFPAGSAAVWRLPEPPGPLHGILVDRAVLRPGDRVRACLRIEGDAVAPPTLRFEPADPSVPPPAFAAPETASQPEVQARWRIHEVRIPDDVRPGSAFVSAGRETVEIPIEGRFPQAGDSDGGGGSPDTPPPPPDPGTGTGAAADGFLLERRDGRWLASGPADAGTVLFYAESGGLLLAHQAVVAMDGAASTALPLGDDPPAKVRVTAIASTPRGYIEAFLGDPGRPARPLDDDPVLSRFLAERPLPEAGPQGPAWIHEGDAPSGGESPPPSRQGYLERHGRAAAIPGRAETVLIPGNARVRWTVRPAGAAGALRIRCDGEILAEARTSAGKGGGELPASDHPLRSILVESDAPGIEAVAFEWTLPGRALLVPAFPGPFVSLDRSLPERGRTGGEVEYRIVIRWKQRAGPSEVVCPVPRGAVPAEDGWSIRSRAPAGTRVEIPDGAVIYRIPPGEPGELALAFRIRLAWPGRYAAPAAVLGTGPDTALSAAGFLVIE